ncbi:hypothetical protein [Cryptosporangium japonicum]|uniref:Uncharacterized protein n=1 Tax=Cryptosporangium japonicum TaxID=80872 RepID=A0ABP3D4L6_9ACTN
MTTRYLASRCVCPLVAIHLSPGGPDRVTATRVATRLAHRERAHARVPVRFRAAVGPSAPIQLRAERRPGLPVVAPPRADGVTRAVTHAAVCPVRVARPSIIRPEMSDLAASAAR